MKSHNIILCFHGKLITNLFKKSRNVFFKVFICFFVKSKLPVRRIPHICINDDRFVRTIKTKFIHFLTIILPHYPLVGEHLPDELGELEPESDGLADGKVTIPTFTAGIYNDTIIVLPESRIKSTLKINRMRTCITIKHKLVF